LSRNDELSKPQANQETDVPEMSCGPRGNLDNGFGGDSAGTSAALVVEKTQDFAERVGAGGVPQERAFAADGHKADVFQFFKMVRERGSGDAKLVLDFAHIHSRGVSGEKKADNLQARFRAERGKAVRGTGNQEWIRPLHNSIVAELWKEVKSYFPGTIPGTNAS
jgi:hypothetical protein